MTAAAQQIENGAVMLNPVDQTGVEWPKGLLAQLHALDPGHGSHGLFLTERPASGEIVLASEFLDPDRLRHAVLECGESLTNALASELPDEEIESQPAAAASRFTRHYLGSVTGLALAGLANGLGLDLAADRCVKVIQNDLPRQQVLENFGAGIRTCVARPSPWDVDGPAVDTVEELRQYAWGRLYGEHVAPLLEAVEALTGATAKLLWSNVAEWVASFADMAVGSLPPSQAALVVEESEAMLNAATLPGVAGPNPLLGQVSWVPVDEPDFPRGAQLRRHCCITYLLPARLGRLCGNCPFLPLEDRIALVREGQERGGPAELRSYEIGRRKLRGSRKS